MPSKFQKKNVSFGDSIKNSIKKIQDDTRKKKADRYGVSLVDYDKAVSEARTRGKKVAYNKFLKDVEKKEYLIQPSKTKKAGNTMASINKILDSFESPKPRRIKNGKYTLKGGKLKRQKTNKSKKRKDDWLGDLGVNF